MKPMLTRLTTILGAVIIAFTALTANAASPGQKKIVLQISDPNPFKQTLVLNVANNLVKEYGEDNIDIEIVAFGPGLRLMFADNVNKNRITELASRDVKFYACSNTFRKMTKLLGKKPVLHNDAQSKGPGVVRIVDLVEKGYLLVKP